MPDTTPILSLPYILSSQAQKHVTHNEALASLDLIVQLSVTSRTLNAPPGGAVAGERHIVGGAPTGAWAGQPRRIAFFNGSAWQFVTPLAGWRAWVAAEAAVAVYTGSVWKTPAESPAQVSELGINTASDPVNRLSVKAEASLFSFDTAHHRVKINKALTANTASVVFQKDFLGLAEIGLLGTNDFAVKVSADGTTFNPALTAAQGTGRVTFHAGIVAAPAAGDLASPTDGTLWYNATTGKFRAREGGASVNLIGSGGGSVFSDSAFVVQDNLDATKQAQFQLAGLTTATTRTYTLPDLSSEVAVLGGAQSFTGAKTFAAGLTASGTAAQIGTAAAAATYGIGTGATTSGLTKAVDVGTAGLAGSVTNVTIGSAVSGALGTTQFNSPTVTYGATVTAVQMASATLTANQMGVGGAAADATNRLSVSAPAVLFNHAGAGHQLKLNKALASDTGSLMFQTGFSGRAEMGTTGSDDFTIKVSPNGSTYFDGLVVDRTTGKLRAMNGLGVTPAAGDLASPADGDLWYNATTGKFRARQGGASQDLLTAVFSDAALTIQDNLDPTKQVQFQVAGLPTATTRVLTVPNANTELAGLGIVQTFTANKTFSGSLTASGSAAAIGTATTTASYSLGAGATDAVSTKGVEVGTLGVAGSITNVTIGSAVAGALGTTTINSPTVSFGAGVTSVQMPAASLGAALAGIGGATPDATNKLSVNAAGALFNHAGAGHDTVINKAAIADAAALTLKTGFSTRAQLGLLGTDNFTLKVSPNGSSFIDALVANATSGEVTLARPLTMTGQAADPGSPVDGQIWFNSTSGQVKVRTSGVTRVLDGQQDLPYLTPVAGEHILTTCGAGGGGTAALAGAVARVDLFPYMARADIAATGLSLNVTVAVAAAVGKVVIYGADAAGRPNTLILETADLDFSTVGVKTATIAQSLLAGRTYWLGIRHASTATLSAWGVTATPDLNGGAPVTTARKVLRRTLAYATAAPATWGFVSSEINAATATAIWIRV